MRVALRRLRTAFTLFKRALPYPEFEAFRAEAKRIASGLGGARTWDVFREMVETGPLTHHQRDESFKALLDAIEERRRLAYDTAHALIDDPTPTRFVLSLQAFLALRAGHGPVGTGELSLAGPAQLFAVETLERLHNQAVKRGKRLLHLSSAERHKVRIALKNLRYAAEFFSEFFGGHSTTKRHLRRIAHLQNLLGASNDAVGARDLLADLETAGPQVAKAAGIVLGWYGRGAKIADDDLRKLWRSFTHNDPFWR
jgi:triphosphatase